jgi:hypothetical protein
MRRASKFFRGRIGCELWKLIGKNDPQSSLPADAKQRGDQYRTELVPQIPLQQYLFVRVEDK